MSIDDAIWASNIGLTAKLAVAGWATALTLYLVDPRFLPLRFLSWLTIITTLCSLQVSFNSGQSINIWLWRAAAILSAFTTFYFLKQWLRVSPRDLHLEEASLDKAKKQKLKSVQRPKHWLDETLLFGGTLLTGYLLFQSVISARAAELLIKWQSSIHTLNSTLMLGTALATSLQMTFGSSPGSLAGVNWSRLAKITLVLFVTEFVVCASLYMRPIKDAESALAIIFALALLLLGFVAWMIPHRTNQFTKTGTIKDWVALVIASWIVTVSYLVLCGLPSYWPWKPTI